MDRIETEKKINIRAWKDPEFKKKLIANPQQALKEFGIENIPSFVTIKVIEEAKNEWNIVLHVPPTNVKNMTEEWLQNLDVGNGCVSCGPGTGVSCY